MPRASSRTEVAAWAEAVSSKLEPCSPSLPSKERQNITSIRSLQAFAPIDRKSGMSRRLPPLSGRNISISRYHREPTTGSVILPDVGTVDMQAITFLESLMETTKLVNHPQRLVVDGLYRLAERDITYESENTLTAHVLMSQSEPS